MKKQEEEIIINKKPNIFEIGDNWIKSVNADSISINQTPSDIYLEKLIGRKKSIITRISSEPVTLTKSTKSIIINVPELNWKTYSECYKAGAPEVIFEIKDINEKNINNQNIIINLKGDTCNYLSNDFYISHEMLSIINENEPFKPIAISLILSNLEHKINNYTKSDYFNINDEIYNLRESMQSYQIRNIYHISKSIENIKYDDVYLNDATPKLKDLIRDGMNKGNHKILFVSKEIDSKTGLFNRPTIIKYKGEEIILKKFNDVFNFIIDLYEKSIFYLENDGLHITPPYIGMEILSLFCIDKAENLIVDSDEAFGINILKTLEKEFTKNDNINKLKSNINKLKNKIIDINEINDVSQLYTYFNYNEKNKIKSNNGLELNDKFPKNNILLNINISGENALDDNYSNYNPADISYKPYEFFLK